MAAAGIAKPSCCKEFKASVEKKHLAYQLLCPVLSTAPFSWCRDIKVQLVDKLLIAYQTVCPNDPIPTIKIGASKFLLNGKYYIAFNMKYIPRTCMMKCCFDFNFYFYKGAVERKIFYLIFILFGSTLHIRKTIALSLNQHLHMFQRYSSFCNMQMRYLMRHLHT